MLLDIGHCFPQIAVGILLVMIRVILLLWLFLLCHTGQKFVKQPVKIKFISQTVFIVLEHLHDQASNPLPVLAFKYQMIVIQAHPIQIFRRTRTRKAHPHIGPGIVRACVIKGHGIRLNEKALPWF